MSLNKIKKKKQSGASSQNRIASKIFFAEKGRYNNGILPYGYKLERLYTSKQLRTESVFNPVVLVEKEASVIKDIFDLYSSGNYTAKEVADILIEKYYKNEDVTKYKIKSLVERTLRRKFYHGMMTLNKKEYPHIYPRIITEELFKKCREVGSIHKNLRLKPIKSHKLHKPKIGKADNKPIKAWKLKSLESGLWVSHYPFGYDHTVLKAKQSSWSFQRGTTVVNSEKKEIVKDIFETFASGGYILTSLAKYIQGKYPDFNLKRANIHNILNTKFYYGVMEWQGREFTHSYPRFITKDLFDMCKFRMDNNTNYSLHIQKEIIKEKPIVILSDIQREILKLLPADLENISTSSSIKLKQLKNEIDDLMSKDIIFKNDFGDYIRKFDVLE